MLLLFDLFIDEVEGLSMIQRVPNSGVSVGRSAGCQILMCADDVLLCAKTTANLQSQ